MMILDRVRIALAFGFALLLVGCSADRKKNADYDRPCQRGETKYGKYCVPAKDEKDAGGERDANTPDKDSGPESDGGGDAGERDAGTDAGMPQSCEQVGKKEVCYPYDGDPLTQLQDPCSAGTWECLDTHVWSECVGYRVPESEKCDGMDNDCNGMTDDGVLPTSCKIEDGSVSGACAENGIGVCSGGDVLCFQIVKPKPEICNAVDDDCDGTTDEGLDRPCYEGSGGCTSNEATKSYDCVPGSTCAPGTLRCVDGEMQTACTDDVRPRAEAGTNIGDTPFDEDCDGTIDEGFDCQNGSYPCYTGIPSTSVDTGPCHAGTRLCTDGTYGACMNEQTPVVETCANEGADNDCDGIEDDIPTRDSSCSDVSTNMGLCKENARWRCAGGAEICVDGPTAAEVCNGRDEDEDCDGSTDEGFNLQTDPNNCGSCGHRCAAGQTCCGGSCVSTATSNAHCGGCNNACNAGLTCCASACVNTRNDVRNCGMCGKQCLLGSLLGCSNGGCL